VVSTVGRIYDLLDKKELNLRSVEMLIMDEADKLLEDDHEVKINSILSQLPKQRRTGLFSATITS
jgi:ATP-dependent RNA helicase DDX55/SPB4